MIIYSICFFLYQKTESLIELTDQVAAENLMYLSQDASSYTETTELSEDPNLECVTEEVITDDWVPGGQERLVITALVSHGYNLVFKISNLICKMLIIITTHLFLLKTW